MGNATGSFDALCAAIKWNEQGWVCAVTQDADSGDVLMQAWMDREALRKTLETGKVHYYSRSRKKLWFKGETSGHVQDLRELRIDCDGDTLLLRVKQHGAACHEGYVSCFFRKLGETELETDRERMMDPQEIYHKG